MNMIHKHMRTHTRARIIGMHVTHTVLITKNQIGKDYFTLAIIYMGVWPSQIVMQA